MLKRKVDIRRKNLEEEITLAEQQGSTISEEDIIQHKISLQHAVSALEKDLEIYIKECPEDIEYPESVLQTQIRGENILLKLNCVYEIFKRSKLQAQNTKLPKLDLFKFDGQAINWQEFYDKFEVTIHNKNLKDVEKLSYLLSCLQGPALETVSGLTINNDNYLIALEALKKRFGSRERLIDTHYRALNDLVKATNNFDSCRRTLDFIEKNLRILQTLGEDINGNHLRPIITNKFPDDILYQVNLISEEDQTVATLRSNLNKVILAKERTNSHMTVDDNAAGSSVGMTTEALHINTKNKNLKRKRVNNFKPHEANKKPRLPCLFCKLNNHVSADCRKFKTIDERKAKLRGRCLNCLRKNHKTEECRRKTSCYRCRGEHLQLFCPNEGKGKILPPEKVFPSVEDKSVTETICENTMKRSCDHIFLQTAVAEVLNPTKNKCKRGRVLMDSGSQRSYITEKLAKSLELSRTDQVLLIYTFGATAPQETSSPSADIVIKTKRGTNRKLQVNIVPRITEKIQVAKYENTNIDIPADDDTVGEGIDVLIGNDFYCSFIRNNKIKIAANLFLIDTDFGWILSGHIVEVKESNVLSVTTYCQCHVPGCPYFTEPDLPLRTIDINFLWSLESIGIIDSPKATRQEEAVRHFNETVKYQDGRYQVKWPWINYPPDLQSNFGLSLGRLKSLLNRIDEHTLNEYDTTLKEQLSLGIIEVVDPHTDREINHPIHYLPHHMVKQKGKRGRLVYDASAKTAGNKSLNENLYSGPSMLEDLMALLLKFRLKSIGIIADVEKAFLQVGLQQEDRDVTRFLWLKEKDKELTDDNLLHLRFCRVPFGIISSPFLLTATIRHHMVQTNEDLLKTIAEKCYVDNLVTAANSPQEANKIYDQTKTAFDQLGMNIRDWVSNSENFLKIIPETQKAQSLEEVKVLGLLWNVKNDTLKLKTADQTNAKDSVKTKREVLRALARVYDPCGFACPLILPMKMIFQKICEKKVKWDSMVPEDLKHALQSSLEFLEVAKQIELPRFVGIDSDNSTTYELHCFTDASKNAYAAAVYLKTQGQHENAVQLLMAKSRISQMKDKENLKIPKQELLGFLIGSRLLKYVRLNSQLSIKKEYLWTDSLVVLGWMNSNKLLPPFVANRVNEIKHNQTETEMYYINTNSNPADVATRPELWNQKKDLWFNGPEFLKKDETFWPSDRHYMTHRTLFSVGEALDVSPGEVGQEADYNPDPVTEFLGENLVDIIDPQIRTSEDESGSTAEIKKLQEKSFPKEMAGERTHLARNLDLYLDVDGLLRCRGRMGNASWDYEMKYPVLLPKEHEFTKNIIKKTHEENYHVGPSHTLSLIRRKYWIPQGKAQVTKIIRKCPQCVKHGGGPYKLPDPPALPPERVNLYQPFSFTGIDYFGPLYVNTSNGKAKRWIALLTCMTIRAVHLEVVNDLSAEECLLALRRFVAIRGVPQRLYSDNATYFKLTSEVMETPYCVEKGIVWKFIPQLAPWHGGFYERLVGIVKHCLKRTLEKHLIHDSKLLTVIKEVEAIVNSRPLTTVGTEVEHILRPADFLSLGKCLTLNPSSEEVPAVGTITKVDLINSWKRGLKIIQEFKNMFIGQYLTSLRERYNHLPKQPRIKSNRIPQIGDLVQIKSDDKNRNKWKTGKIVSLIEGSDSKHRVAKVQVDDSVLTRSVGHLYPLEVEERVEADKSISTAPTPESEENGTSHKPTHEVMDIEPEPENLLTDSDVTMEVENDSMVASSNEVLDIDVETENATTNTDDTIANESQEEVQRGKRDAAIRAREKILEWTRQLLNLLN